MSRRQQTRPRASSTHKPSSLSRWAQEHRSVAKTSLWRILKTPASSLMTSFVIAVSLLLPALLLGLNSNLAVVLSGFQNSAQITVYLEQGLPESSAIVVSDNLLTRADIINTRYISAEQALRDFGTASGLGQLSEELTENPLPAAIVITPQDPTPESVEALAQQLEEIPEATLVQVDSRWLQRLQAISDLVSIIGQILTLIVVLGLFFIVGNTIKLAIENRKDEIRVIKLVGGSNLFIARPFLYAGLFFGLAGGICASGLQAVVLLTFNSSLAELMLLYESSFELAGFGIINVLLLIFAGAVIGWSAAFLASFRHIRAINP